MKYYSPSPLDRPPVEGTHPKTEKLESRKPEKSEPFCGLVFKILPAKTGDLYWIRVYSGELTANTRVFCPSKNKKENIAQLWQIHATKKERDGRVDSVTCGDTVGVIGIGGLGHMALQFLNAWGCRGVAFTSGAGKREEALSMGAHDTLNSRDPEEVKAAAGSFDMIMSTVNVKLDWGAYLAALKPKGRLHLLGVTLDPLDLAEAGSLFFTRPHLAD